MNTYYLRKGKISYNFLSIGDVVAITRKGHQPDSWYEYVLDARIYYKTLLKQGYYKPCLPKHMGWEPQEEGLARTKNYDMYGSEL